MDVFTQKQAAKLLGWSLKEIKKAITTGIALAGTERHIILSSESNNGTTVIPEEALDAFIDQFENAEPGRHPPVHVRRSLLVEANHQCGICSSDAPLQYHHIIEWHTLKHHDADHMMAVCANCHAKIGEGTIDRISQQQYKERLQQRSYRVLDERIDSRSISERRRARMGPFLEPGDVLKSGDFKLMEQLGKGGFATVWKVHQRSDPDTLFAIKVLHQQWTEDLSRRERFTRGAREMRKLSHPNIVEVYGEPVTDTDLGVYYYAMEYCDGLTLDRHVLQTKPKPEAVLELLAQVAEALGYAHSLTVVHRDIKPTNILVEADDAAQFGYRAKVTDFDLVRAADTTGGTRTGAIGTVFFIAPEQMTAANNVESPADIYSLGMTALSVLSGRPLVYADFRDPHSAIRQLNILESVKLALMGCLAETPHERPSASEVALELRRCIVGPVTDLTDDPPSWLSSSDFNDTCRTRYAAPYTRVRESLNWPDIQNAIDELATEAAMITLHALYANTLPFGSEKAVHLSAQTFVADRLDGANFGGSDSHLIINWLVQRRLLISASEITKGVHNQDRSRLEGILTCYWNIIPPSERDQKFVQEERYKKSVVSLRPVVSRLGLIPRELAKGYLSIPNIGTLEQRWLSGFLSSGLARSFAARNLPSW